MTEYNNNSEKNKQRLLYVNDKFQNYVNKNFPEIKKYSLLNELIFYGIFIYYYYFGPIQDSVQNFLIVKYIILVLVLRYVFNSLTNLTDINKEDKENKKISYFQFNSKLAIFIIIIFFLSKTNDSLNSNTTLAIIFGYTLLTSAINTESTTVDNIYTVILILYVFSLSLLS